jgi:hypothetical protein
MLDISCIYVNYNSSLLTIDAIESMMEKTGTTVTYEIVIVDNASKHEEFEVLQRYISRLNLPHVRLYRSRINTGFGGGNMMAVSFCTLSKYYAFINNDTLFINPQTLYDLKHFMESTPDAGICGPQMLNGDQQFVPSIDHYASPMRQLVSRDLMERFNPKKYPVRKKRYDRPVSAGYVPGCFMFVNSSYFNEIGGFDTALFLYYEETDLCRRMFEQLYKKTYLVPHLEYIHLQGKSTDRNILIKIEQKISLLYLIQKFHGRWARAGMCWFYILKYLVSAPFSSKKRIMFTALWKGARMDQSLRCKQVIHDR